MSRGPSLATRAFLAVSLMVGFYTLALAIAGALLYIPYAEWVYLDRIHARLVLACVVGAATVLWSILPRPDRFEPPGPQLDPSDQPQLLDMIGKVAAGAGQQPPVHVYLTLEVNAWVTERGGIMGFGSRRVMGLGLPLLEALTVDEARAVIAHEFGHYSAGDTKLGPWVYKTRSAIERSLSNLEEKSWLRAPFAAYGKLFMRITAAVSRQQEFAADALAARIAGAELLSSGLKKLGGVSAAFSGFWRQEYAPVLQSARIAPIAGGFAAFLSRPRIAARLAELSAEQLDEEAASPYDTHPTTASRCAALESIRTAAGPRDGRPATSLLQNPVELERKLLIACVGTDLSRFECIDWNSVAERVWIAHWREDVSAQAGALAGHTVADIATLAADPAPVGRRMKFSSEYLPDEEERCVGAIRLLGTALGIALYDSGWAVAGDVGEPLTFSRAGETIEPISLVQRLASDADERVDWPVRSRRLGITSLPLNAGEGSLAAAAAAGDSAHG